MIVIDEKVFSNLELAMPFFKAALKIEIYRERQVTALPDTPNATYVRYDNLPLVTALPDTPNATYVCYYNLPLVTQHNVRVTA